METPAGVPSDPEKVQQSLIELERALLCQFPLVNHSIRSGPEFRSGIRLNFCRSDSLRFWCQKRPGTVSKILIFQYLLAPILNLFLCLFYSEKIENSPAQSSQ